MRHALALLLLLVIALGAFSVIFSLQGKTIPTLYTILPVVFFMILVRELVRVSYLKPYFSITDMPRAIQYSPFLAFLLFFVGGIVLLGWMLRLVWKTFSSREAQS